MTEIRVPTLGESVTEATIGRWFKKAGDAVAVDEPLVELETDKVTIEVPAPSAGTLSEIIAADGATVAVGALLGQITEGAGATKPAAAPALTQEQKDHGVETFRLIASAMQSQNVPDDVKSALQNLGIDGMTISSPPKAASMPRQFRAPARTAASPRATCWLRSSVRPPRRPRSISPPPPCRSARRRRPMTPPAKSASR